MQPTVSGLSQLDEPPGPHRTQEEALDASDLKKDDLRIFKKDLHVLETKFLLQQRDNLFHILLNLFCRSLNCIELLFDAYGSERTPPPHQHQDKNTNTSSRLHTKLTKV